MKDIKNGLEYLSGQIQSAHTALGYVSTRAPDVSSARHYLREAQTALSNIISHELAMRSDALNARFIEKLSQGPSTQYESDDFCDGLVQSMLSGITSSPGFIDELNHETIRAFAVRCYQFADIVDAARIQRKPKKP